jgi:hypothetical protein
MSSFPAGAGFGAELALCSAEGKFLGVAHSWCSCEVELSSERRNEHVFSMAQSGAGGPDSEALCSLKSCNGLYLCAGSQLLEHERTVGTSLKPFWWKIMRSGGGLVALYSAAHSAFLGNDLSLHLSTAVLVQTEVTNKSTEESHAIEFPPCCLWLSIPVPLKCEDGRPDGYYSVTRLLHWGHDSAVLLTEYSSLRAPGVVKSVPCARAAAIRRIDSFLYQSNMPGAADCRDLFCPLLGKVMQISPSCFYAQKLCFRSLEHIFAECAVAYNDSGDRRLPLSISLTIIRRVIDVVSAVHALGFVVLDASPSSFCEGERGDIASLQLVDMKNMMKLEPKTYSTPASFVTKSGGRFGVPTGLFAMVSHASLFLGHLNANCFYAAPEVLKTPGSVGCAADVFSIASVLVWCVTGAAPCVHMSRDLLGLGCYSDKARALVPSLISTMHEPVQQGDHLVRHALLTLFVTTLIPTQVPDSSAASAAIVDACCDAPGLAKVVLAALAVVPERRPGMEDFAASVDAALARVGAKHDAVE